MNKKLERLVLASFFLSGTAALIYEISWLKLAGLYFEGTAYASATVVAIFMGGLALGSYLAGKLARRVEPANRRIGEPASNEQRATSNNLLFLYFNLEALIALVALTVPFLFIAVRPLFGVAYRTLYDIPVLYHIARLLISTVVMLPTVTLMGLTLPLLIEALTREHRELSRKSGFLYGINCLGAAVGAGVAGFLLLPALGIFKTTLVAVVINLVIAVVGWSTLGRWPWSKLETATGRRGDGASKPGTDPSPIRRFTDSPVRPYILAIFAVAGFCALNYEIIWTRIMVANIGPASYSFATILGCFILGLALGSSLYAAIARRIRDKVFSCGLLLMLAALAAVGATLFLPRLPFLAASLIKPYTGSFLTLSLVKYLLAGIVILPLTIFSGALFPAAAAAYTRDASRLSEKIGRLYAVNSVGSIIGSLFAGFILLPLLGAHNAGLPIIALQFTLGLYVIAKRRGVRMTACLASLPLIACVALILLPRVDPKVLFGGSYLYFQQYLDSKTPGKLRENQDLLYHKDGPGGSVSVRKLQGHSKIFFAVNGKTDGSSEGADMTTQTFSAHLPLLLHPDAENVLVIGLGTGTTFATSLLYPLKQSTCVEISPQVIEATKLFHPIYGGDPLRDPRAKMVVGDGRSHLFFSREKYDVIIAEPSNPWMSGTGNLFTEEYFQAMRHRLKENGIACQWLQGYRIKTETFKTIIRTFSQTFPHVSLWWVNINKGDFLLLGSRQQHRLSLSFLEEKIKEYKVEKHFYIKRLMTPYTFLRCFVAADDQLRQYAAEGEIITDDNTLLEFTASRELYTSELALLHKQLAALSILPLPILAEEDAHRPEVKEKLAFYQHNRREFIDFFHNTDPDGRWNNQSITTVANKWSLDEDVSVALAYNLTEYASKTYVKAKKSVSSGEKQKLTQRSIAGLNAALSLNQNQLEAYLNLATIYKNEGALIRCLETIEQALSLGINNVRLYDMKGAVTFLLARQHQNKAGSLDSGGDQMERNKHLSLARRYYREANTAFRRAIEMDPVNPNYQTYLAVTLYNLGNQAAALKYIHKALELDPDNEKAKMYQQKIRQSSIVDR